MFRRIIRPLRSRKVRIALTTIIAAVLADWGLELSDTLIFSGIGIGVSLILGIAHEDNGRNAASSAMIPRGAPDLHPSQQE